MATSLPGSVDSFTTHSAGQTLDPTQQNDLQSAVMALEYAAGLHVYDAIGYGGADPTGTTDAAAALQGTNDAALAAGGLLYLNPGTYKVLSRVNLTAPYVDGRLATITTPNVLLPAVEVGYADHVTLLGNVAMWLPRIVQSAKTWASGTAYADCALAITNTYNSEIHCAQLKQFAIGAWLRGYSAGPSYGLCAYNALYFRTIEDCKNSVLLQAGDSNGFSYVNENAFHGGRWYTYEPGPAGATSNVTGVKPIRVLCDATPNAFSQPNNNRFYSVSLEGNLPQYHLEDGGTDNLYDWCRWETNTGLEFPKVHWLDSSASLYAQHNLIRGGYYVDKIVQTQDTHSNLRNVVQKSVGIPISSGFGSPESVIVGTPGDVYLNRSGGAGTTLYIKESGTGNTGWVGK